VKSPRIAPLGASRLLFDQRGVSTAEYLILVGVIAVLGLGAWRIFGQTIKCKIMMSQSAVAQANPDGARSGPNVPQSCLDQGSSPTPPPPAAPPTATIKVKQKIPATPTE
jgi:Flp pilus assembly pilin Flp